MRLNVQNILGRPLAGVALLLGILFLTGCGAATDDTAISRINERVPNLSLDISASEVTEGGSVTLTWYGYLISSCVAAGDWSGSRASSGREVISGITEDSQFYLSCSSPEGVLTDSAQVRVVAQVMAPSLAFSSSDSRIMRGDSVALSWYATNADSCIASGDWEGVRSTEGLQNLNNLLETSVFILECSGNGRQVRQSVTVEVQQPEPAAPTMTLTASSGSVDYDGSVTLSWSSTGADDCIASGDWSGSKPVNGRETIDNLMADSQFSLECSGAGGTVSRQVDVSVAPQQNNGTARLSWTPPTENTDNTPLQDLAGFKIYYGTASGNYSETIDVASAGITDYLIENLPNGTWYFVVTAYNALGIESAPSEEVSKTIN